MGKKKTMATAALPSIFVDNQPSKRVLGIDTLRFFMALWVVFSHFGFLPLDIDQSHFIGNVIAAIYGNIFSGPAAVIVFFVISGFCIHYPYRHGKKLLLIPYFARRHIRIWIPIFIAILIGNPLGVRLTVIQDSILWSLVAEEIYYLIYPVLLLLKKKWGWKNILLVSYVGAILVILQDPLAGNYPSYGGHLNWLLGLPCWLLGCCLAEREGGSFKKSHNANINILIWRWRLTAWFLSWSCSALRFYSPVKYPWTLTVYAIFVFFWLEKEIIYYQIKTPSSVLENAGKGSYSIYLIHLHGAALYAYLSLPITNMALQWLIQIALTLLVCYIFYFFIEKPSHFLARNLAARLSLQVLLL